MESLEEKKKKEILLEAITDAYVKKDLEPIAKPDVERILLEWNEPFDLKSWFKVLEEDSYIEKVGNRWKPTVLTMLGPE